MKIYTKTGDKGTSSLYSGERVSKANQIFNVLGELDRLNCDLGFIRSYKYLACIHGIISIQQLIIKIGSCIGTKPSNQKRYEKTRIKTLTTEVDVLEKQIDKWTKELPPLTTFLTPGNSEHAVRVHRARTTCRSLERQIVGLCESIKEEAESLRDIGFTTVEYEDKKDLISEETRHKYDNMILFLNDMKEISKYFNRLSDYLFTLARYIEEIVDSWLFF